MIRESIDDFFHKTSPRRVMRSWMPIECIVWNANGASIKVTYHNKEYHIPKECIKDMEMVTCKMTKKGITMSTHKAKVKMDYFMKHMRKDKKYKFKK